MHRRIAFLVLRSFRHTELESKFALYPRIVVDPALLAEFRENELLKAAHHDLEDEEGYVSRLVRRGDDGIWFVDYIRAIESELDEPEMYPIFLQTHRQLILDGGKRFAGLNGPMSKYLWLAAYHNDVIGELKSKWFKYYGLKRAELLISPKDLPALQELRSNPPVHRTRRKRHAADQKR